MISDSADTKVYIIGDSITSNSLGRVLSMAITAKAAFNSVEILAYNDGAAWAGLGQFGLHVRSFSYLQIRRVADEIRDHASRHSAIVWVSKGAAPIPNMLRRLRKAPNIVIIADFDDNDVAIMKNFRTQSRVNAIKMNALRRKHPRRLQSSQRRTARAANGVTFSNSELAKEYSALVPTSTTPWSIVPHTRAQAVTVRREATRSGNLRLGFLGTIRPHKGASRLVRLLRHDRGVTLISFEQQWSPPADCSSQWITHPPATPLADLYNQIDLLVLPMDSRDEAALHQLPAKLVDAAANGCPVAATPTPPIMEFAGDAVQVIDNWDDAQATLDAIRSANLPDLSTRIRRTYDEKFSPDATAMQLIQLLGDIERLGHTA